MYTKDLEQLIQTEEVRSNPVLQNDLERLLKASYYYITNYLTDIQPSSYKFLLDNKHIRLNDFLNNILRNNKEGNSDTLLDLALSLKPNFEELYSLPSTLSKSDIAKLVASGLSLNKIVKLVLVYYHLESQNEEINSQAQLTKDLVEMGASLTEVHSVGSYFNKEMYEFMLAHGMQAEKLLYSLFSLKPSEKREELIDLILSFKPNFEELSSLPSALSKSDIAKLIASGLSLSKIAKLALSITYHENQKDEISSQAQLINDLIERKASFEEAFTVPNYFNFETYQLLMQNGLRVEIIFQLLVQLPESEIRGQLFDLVLENKMDFSNSYSPSGSLLFNEIIRILEAGFSAEDILTSILKQTSIAYKHENSENEQRVLSESEVKLLDFFKGKGTDFNRAFIEIVESTSTTIGLDGIRLPYVIPKTILKTLIESYALNPNLVLQYAISNKVYEFAQLAIDAGADVNYREDDSEPSFYVQALRSNLLEVVKLLVEAGASQEINIKEYILILRNLDFNLVQKIVAKYQEKFSNEQLYETFRSFGVSESSSRAFLDYHDLVKEYLLAKQGEDTSLSEIEISILEGNINIENLSLYNRDSTTNKYGFNALHLSIISKQYAFAGALIRDGFDVNTKSHNNILPLQLLSYVNNDNYNEVLELFREVADLVENVDIKLGAGETLTDILITHNDLEAQIIQKTTDPLFYFFKNDTDLFYPSKFPEITHIAISHGENFWSTGVWSTARIARENHPNVSFHLVTSEMLEKGGESFIRQFDAVINPGAGDTYPKLPEFKKEDCSFKMTLERHYQDILEISHKHNIPYLGMCAGAQHFSMYHEGTLSPLKGYNKGAHKVTYQKATLPYFMVLTKDQQKALLETCEFPDISFKGDTAHNYAAVHGKLGTGLELGAVSEDNIPMSYGHENGIRYATQFHPEHYYDNLDDANTINQKAWIDNFIGLAVMHHNHRAEGVPHPIEYFAQIRMRLDECAGIQTTLSGDNSTEIVVEAV